MKHNVFSVYDAKAKTFCVPFQAVNKEVAIRDFQYAANDTTTTIGRYPHDFTLYYIGLFNDQTAQYELSDPEPLAMAIALVGLSPEENVNVV